MMHDYPWRQLRKDLRKSIVDLFFYYLLFSVLAFVLLSPFAAWLFSWFIASSGRTAVGNFDIALFLMKPSRLLLALAATSLFAAISFFRIGGQLVIGYGLTDNCRITYSQAFLLVLRRAGPVILLSLVVLGLLTGILLPFLLIAGLLAHWLLGAHDINHYLEARPPEFWGAVGVGGLLGMIFVGLAAYLVLRIVFSLPNVLLQQSNAVSAIRHSLQQTSGRWWRIGRFLLVWLLVWLLIFTVFNWSWNGLAERLVAMTTGRVRLLVLTLGGITAFGLAVNSLLGFLAEATACLGVVRLYRALEGTAIDLPEPANAEKIASGHSLRVTLRKGIFPFSLVLLVLSAFVVRGLLERVRWEDQVEISAHRGSSLAAPENTLSAVRQAINDGADFVEIDVQRTRDGKLIVTHDADLMRVAKQAMVISQTDFAELSQVDVGSRFDPQFAQERLPTLEQVIAEVQGKVKLIVELKSYKGDAKQLVRDVVDLLRDRQLGDDAVIMSLKYDELAEVRRVAPERIVGFVASTSLGDLTKLDVDFLAISQGQATDLLIATAHSRGKQVFVWTVDDPAVAHRMIDGGVDNIITNDPAMIGRVLQDRQNLTNADRILLRFRSLYLD